MFTGIIRNLGHVTAVTPFPGGGRLLVRPDESLELESGESVAVNGVCLTAIPLDDGLFAADLSTETLGRTTLGRLVPGDLVNLEQAMRFSDRVGGHLVQGHVDCVATLIEMEPQGEFALWRWSYPMEYERLVVEKGSVSLDGISLTIVEPREATFAVALIPETLRHTNMKHSAVGSTFNIEFDLMAKYAERFLAPYVARVSSHGVD